eukprot:6926318-Prymnesium_polylepis.1
MTRHLQTTPQQSRSSPRERRRPRHLADCFRPTPTKAHLHQPGCSTEHAAHDDQDDLVLL